MPRANLRARIRAPSSSSGFRLLLGSLRATDFFLVLTMRPPRGAVGAARGAIEAGVDAPAGKPGPPTSPGLLIAAWTVPSVHWIVTHFVPRRRQPRASTIPSGPARRSPRRAAAGYGSWPVPPRSGEGCGPRTREGPEGPAEEGGARAARPASKTAQGRGPALGNWRQSRSRHVLYHRGSPSQRPLAPLTYPSAAVAFCPSKSERPSAQVLPIEREAMAAATPILARTRLRRPRSAAGAAGLRAPRRWRQDRPRSAASRRASRKRAVRIRSRPPPRGPPGAT